MTLAKITTFIIIWKLVLIAHARIIVGFKIVQTNANPKVQYLLDPTGINLVNFQSWSRSRTLQIAIVVVAFVRHPRWQVRNSPAPTRLDGTTSRRNHRRGLFRIFRRARVVFVKPAFEGDTILQIGFGKPRKVCRHGVRSSLHRTLKFVPVPCLPLRLGFLALFLCPSLDPRRLTVDPL